MPSPLPRQGETAGQVATSGEKWRPASMSDAALCPCTRRYGDNVSAAASSTNTNEQPDHNYKRAGHGQRGVLARDTASPVVRHDGVMGTDRVVDPGGQLVRRGHRPRVLASLAAQRVVG